ncbi:MAG: hypothetical protein COW30_11910 [Rhodospirillales bacterium CG15_BIG_FIL_POST_REV_8_21_14_020_66_15]|nr:MAG: hypothetical protein COW30_11910 [Rhodospirillales bacterium CG15_BIG_FIL_POST_REV_8_21_14_020_66_15]
MPFRPAAIALAVLFAFTPAQAAEAPWRALPRAEMLEEDSHPHEVRPGDEARFHTLPAARTSFLDVKCSLTGPAERAAIVTSGMALKDWPLDSLEFEIQPGATLWIDIIAVVRPETEKAPYFAFRNMDASRLLWHQCYNN